MAAVWTLGGGISATQQHDQHAAGTHQHPAAAKLKNPVKADAASIAAGKKLFTAQCVSCHGESGKGNGKAGATLNPKPSDLTDAAWKHGATDGEIFTVIRDGAPKTSMRGYASRMTTQELWSIVNYLRTLGPSPNSQ
jgi:mono/diheme cytochrome c family protein